MVTWQVFMQHKFLMAHHVDKVIGQFGLCDIISTPYNFQIAGFFIFKSIWSTWKQVAGLVH